MNTLASEVVGNIAKYLTSDDILALHSTGDTKLIQKLMYGVTSVSEQFHHIFHSYRKISSITFIDRDYGKIVMTSKCRVFLDFHYMGNDDEWESEYFDVTICKRGFTKEKCIIRGKKNVTAKLIELINEYDDVKIFMNIYERECRYDSDDEAIEEQYVEYDVQFPSEIVERVDSYMGRHELIKCFPYASDILIIDDCHSNVPNIGHEIESFNIYISSLCVSLRNDTHIDLVNFGCILNLELYVYNLIKLDVKFPTQSISLLVNEYCFGEIEYAFHNPNVYRLTYDKHNGGMGNLLQVFPAPTTITKLDTRYKRSDGECLRRYTSLKSLVVRGLDYESRSTEYPYIYIKSSIPYIPNIPSITKLSIFPHIHTDIDIQSLENLHTLKCKSFFIERWPRNLKKFSTGCVTNIHLESLPQSITSLKTGTIITRCLSHSMSILPKSITSLSGKFATSDISKLNSDIMNIPANIRHILLVADITLHTSNSTSVVKSIGRTGLMDRKVIRVRKQKQERIYYTNVYGDISLLMGKIAWEET